MSGLTISPHEECAVEEAVRLVSARLASTAAYDLVLLGNEASDTGDYQVGIRLAHLLGRPVVTGIKSLSIAPDGTFAGMGAGDREPPAQSSEFVWVFGCYRTLLVYSARR
jgi:electron transfer flavoprotein alpha/beta subunit